MVHKTDAYESVIAENNSIRRSIKAALPVLSLAIVIGVFWWLKLTGITLAGEAFCGLEEHVHTAACAQTLICEETESEEHTHTLQCYEEIVCGLDEHIHVTACYSNVNADLETPAVWEETLQDALQAETTVEKLVALAQSQLGYTESIYNFQVDDTGIRHGYTRYGQWYGNPYGSWSAMFVDFCLSYAGVTADMAPYNSGTNTMMLQWKNSSLFMDADAYTPLPGDIVFLDSTGSGSCTDVGIVTAASDTVTVIQGDSSDAVEENTYALTDERVLGYGSIRSVIWNTLSGRDKRRIENTKAEIAALPEEEDVIARMESLNPSSQEFADWYHLLSLEVVTAYVYYEDLGPEHRTLVVDTQKLDALSWTWQAATMRDAAVYSVSVFQSNQYGAAVPTIVYGGSVQEVMGDSLDYAYWDAYVIEKNDNGYYVSAINREVGSKLATEASTSEGFVLLIWHGSEYRANLTELEVGASVMIDPAGFYTTSQYSTSAIGTLTFSTAVTDGSDNTAENTGKLNVITGADTSKLIEVNLFDYGSNINDLYLTDHKYPGFQQDAGTKSLTSLGRFGFNFGNNITADIATQIGDVTTNDPGDINKTQNGANSSISGAILDYLQDGYPALSDGTSIGYLFSESVYATKKNTNSINGLFLYNEETGAYTFDSRKNHAQFNSTNDTFVLYEQIISSNFIMYPFGNFLPFNDIVSQTTQATTVERSYFLETAAAALHRYNNSEGDIYLELYQTLTQFVTLMDTEFGSQDWDYKDVIDSYFTKNSLEFTEPFTGYLDTVYSIDYDEATDFFFGMDMHMEFIQPKGGLTGLDGKQPMVFEFTGDDDVWIYVDGKLFLDLTGIHRHVGGTIDFVTGTVYYYDLDPATGMISETPTNTVSFADILGTAEGLNAAGTFEDYSQHTLDFFYMERGAGSGVCRMNFNLPLIQKNSISVSKELETDADTVEALGNPDFSFQVYKEGGSELLIGPGTEYTVYNRNGQMLGTGVTDANGVFTIKAGQWAVFGDIPENAGKYFVRELLDTKLFEQYGTVTVDGVSATTDTYEDVLVGTDAFKGVDSSLKDISDGSTAFTFYNRVDATKYGRLEITKVLTGTSADQAAKEFAFQLSFDGIPIPAGTAYTLVEADGTEQTAYIAEDGVLKLLAGQTARFDHVLSGSSVCLKESDASAEGYFVTYTGENTVLTETADGVTGTVGLNTAVKLTVVNDQNGTQLQIPGTKTLLYPDGTSRTFTFVLQQIVSAEDHSPVADGAYMKSTVTLASGTSDFLFTLNYTSTAAATGKYYYLITEENAVAAEGMDTAQYVAEVAVTVTGDEVTAQITRILKNGTECSDIAFTNRVIRSLIISKTVENISAPDTEFLFEIFASVDGVPLNGEYTAQSSDGQITVVFTDGAAAVMLKHGQSITINGLPYGTEWTVTEQETDDFFTKCGLEGQETQAGNAISGSLTENAAVCFVNIGGYKLPSTGSLAGLMFIFGGAALMALALICGCVLRYKRGRRFGD